VVAAAGGVGMDLAEVLALNWLSERLTLTMGLFYAYSARITQKFLEV